MLWSELQTLFLKYSGEISEANYINLYHCLCLSELPSDLETESSVSKFELYESLESTLTKYKRN